MTDTGYKKLANEILKRERPFNYGEMPLTQENHIKEREFAKVSSPAMKFPDVETPLPTRATSGSAGYDFYSKETATIMPQHAHPFYTDVKVNMENDDVLFLYVRSSIGIKRNLMLANGTGVIDSDYFNSEGGEGNIIVCLFNYGDKPVIIEAGERIAQGVYTKYLTAKNDAVLETERAGGIGSSGK